jgi:uncharacterized protein YndB with AHSA1/START domain
MGHAADLELSVTRASATRYRARVRHLDEEAVKQHGAMGFVQGWSQVAERLAELAEANARDQAA